MNAQWQSRGDWSARLQEKDVPRAAIPVSEAVSQVMSTPHA